MRPLVQPLEIGRAEHNNVCTRGSLNIISQGGNSGTSVERSLGEEYKRH